MIKNYLQYKFNKLVIKEIDTALWNGLVLKDHVYTVEKTYVYSRSTMTTFVATNYYNVFILKIPKKAKKLTIRTNSEYNFSGDRNAGIGYVNGYVIGPSNSSELIITLDKAYDLIAISLRENASKLLPNATFVFE